MTDKKKTQELNDEELGKVQGGAETPIAASRFGISIDGVQIAKATDAEGHEITHTIQQSGDTIVSTDSKG